MKKTILVFLLAMSSFLAFAQESQTEYNFLKIPLSAHAAALGGENISIIENDPSLIFSNPALAASVSDLTIGLNYMNYMKGANYMGASFVKVAAEKTTIAFAAQYMNYGKMKEYDANKTEIGTFSASEMAIEAILAYELANNLVGGITGKFISSNIGQYNSLAAGVDLGLNYFNPEKEWSLSIVAKNLGGQIKAYEEDFGRMPFDLQLGVSKTFEALPVRASATLVDMTHYNYRFANHICLGADLLLSSNIWLGIGYNFRKADEMKIGTGDNQSAHGAGLSLGAGINLERFKLNLAYGKYHASTSSIIVNLAYSL